jgi:hypothetical protein
MFRFLERLGTTELRGKKGEVRIKKGNENSKIKNYGLWVMSAAL